ncbi:MAG: phosphate/phosphite/phosphonate ABC transporter substrate-binding protein [Phycisphaerae bacterium]|nr:phosphate/phosphite/phosphonate ABC transporter substrate-binding protein [Phycisphaerae bacterium]
MSRFCKCVASLVTIALLSGCQLGARVVGFGTAVHVGSSRLGSISLLPAEFYALHPELEKLFGQPVVFDTVLSGRTMGKQLAAGHLHYAFLTAAEYAELPSDAAPELLAAAVNKKGETKRNAIIVANARSNVKALADLKGQRFAFGPAKDMLLDRAAVAVLQKAGVTLADIKKEIPPFSLSGRLNVGGGSPEIAKIVAFDAGVPGGVIDEITYNDLPASGGSLLGGPSRDMFRVLGETEPMPEMVVAASPKADPVKVAMLKNYLISNVKNKPDICKQLGVTGFAEPDAAAFEAVRRLAAP